MVLLGADDVLLDIFLITAKELQAQVFALLSVPTPSLLHSFTLIIML